MGLRPNVRRARRRRDGAAARGALGRVRRDRVRADYHARVRSVLERIAADIDELAGKRATRIVCDTAPLAERAYAARAGLGWVGKHTNVIVPALGSYVFLGEIVTTLALEPDAPSIGLPFTYHWSAGAGAPVIAAEKTTVSPAAIV